MYLEIKKLDNSHTGKLQEVSQLLQISNQLILAHTPKVINIQKQYHFSSQDTITGVQCPNCFRIPMLYRRQKWYCDSCRYSSSNAYLNSLIDYKLLFGNRITNKEARFFLNMESRHIVKRLIQLADCQMIGKGKGSFYLLESSLLDSISEEIVNSQKQRQRQNMKKLINPSFRS